MKKSAIGISLGILLQSLALLPASADAQTAQWLLQSTSQLEEGADGSALTEAVYHVGDFVVVTDGSAPEGLEALLPGCSISELTWQPDALTWETTVPESMQDAEGLRYFAVTLPDESTVQTNEDGSQILVSALLGVQNGVFSPELRSYLQAHDEVLDLLQISAAADAVMTWDGTFTATVVDGENPDITEFSGYDEIMAELAAAESQLSDYALLLYAEELAEALCNDNADLCAHVAANQTLTPDLNTAVYAWSDAWNRVGDVNNDTAVSAVDAADLLIYAADSGTGTGSPLAIDALWASDINADGAADSTDAAFILRYAAYIGSGGTMTLEEFLATN